MDEGLKDTNREQEDAIRAFGGVHELCHVAYSHIVYGHDARVGDVQKSWTFEDILLNCQYSNLAIFALGKIARRLGDL